MCGRYTLKPSPEELLAHLALVVALPALWRRRYNVAPTQDVLCVRAESAPPTAALLRWGLVPAWAKDPAIGARLINARAETVFEKPAFRGAARRRRCLVPADGFYEWRRVEGQRTKQPYHLRRRDGGLFCFAGLWERWRAPSGEVLESCAVLTTTPNAVVAPIHDRMPVLLEPADYLAWLDPDVDDPAQLGALLRPYPAEPMEAYPVGREVGNARVDRPGLDARVALPGVAPGLFD